MTLNHDLQHAALDTYRGKIINQDILATDDFQNLGLNREILKGIQNLSFIKPTPIQREAIPLGLSGHDIIAIAQTGSGKTLAFGLPMLQRLAKNKRGIGLVIVPTRELALQVEEALRFFGKIMRIRSTVLIGGASMIMQRNDLRKNPRVIIATPGRLLDHLDRKTVDLSMLDMFVLDEADRMLDMGFIPDVKKIIKAIPGKRQTMLFSATMPDEIETIANSLMTNPVRIEIDRSGATPAEVSQEMFVINNQDKSRLLAHHLKARSGPVLVFTRTKRMASKLTSKVNSMGYSAAEIHSDRSLGQRRNALEGFKRGKYRILIATDIAARGIDVSGIELVVNYDMPANSEDYVHRIGRTGRAGKSGHAISFANTAQRGSIRSLERYMNTRLTISKIPALPSEKRILEEAESIKQHAVVIVTPPHMIERSPIQKRKPGKKQFPKPSGYKKAFGDESKAFQHAPAPKKAPLKQKPAPEVSQADQSENASSGKKPFWTIFSKNRPAKKKFSGKNPGRKKRFRQQ